MDYLQAKQELQHWFAHEGKATNFTALLFSLISKADPMNKRRLAMGFPNEVKVFDDWMASDSAALFFMDLIF